MKKTLSAILAGVSALAAELPGKYPEHKALTARQHRTGTAVPGASPEENVFYVEDDDGKLSSFVLLDKDADGNYFVITENEYGTHPYTTMTRDAIIHGIEGKFYPDRSITYAEAATMLVNALGGKGFAEYEGAYNIGYLKLADNMGIKKNITAGADTDVTVGMAARLLLNAGKAEVFTPVISGDKVELKKGDTLFWEKQRISNGKGILSANQYTAIDGRTKAEKIR